MHKTAANYYNLNRNTTLLEKIGVHCYTPKGLEERFGIEPNLHVHYSHSPTRFLDTDIINMEDYIDRITDPYYQGTNEKLGMTFFGGNYYVASSNLNKYSFTIIDRMRKGGRGLRRGKQDIYDLFYLYHYFKANGEIPECDNGE